MIDTAALIADLKPLSLEASVNDAPLWIEYRRFYQLDRCLMGEGFSDLGVEHYVGKVSTPVGDMAAHYFLPAVQQQSADRPTVLLIHGLFDHAALWRHVIHAWLNRGYGVFAFDLPGHGFSEGPEVAIADFAQYQQVLQAILLQMQQLGLTCSVAIGQSTGGAILSDYLLSARRSGVAPAIAKAILFSPLVRPTEWTRVRCMYYLLSPFLDYIARDFSVKSNDPDFVTFLKDQDPLQSKRVSAKWVGALVRWVAYFKALPCSDIPILILQGERDDTVDYRYNLQILAEKFPKNEQHSLPEAYHHLMGESVAQQRKMWGYIDKFLSD